MPKTMEPKLDRDPKDISDIRVSEIDEEEIEKKKVREWSVWTKKPSRFDWYYDRKETCYLVEGKAIVETRNNRVVIQAGDYVEFPAGLNCTWKVLEPIKKYYRLEDPEEN